MKTNESSVITVKFAARLREAREMCSLTQADLGAACGMSGQWISHFEAGRRLPNIENLVRIADALKVSTDFLLGV